MRRRKRLVIHVAITGRLSRSSVTSEMLLLLLAPPPRLLALAVLQQQPGDGEAGQAEQGETAEDAAYNGACVVGRGLGLGLGVVCGRGGWGGCFLLLLLLLVLWR